MLIDESYELEVEPTSESVSGKCDCCGSLTRTIFGYVHYRDAATVSAYCVRWTVGNPDHDPWFLFSLGPWGEGTSAANRCSIAAVFGSRDDQPSFMIVDAEKLEWRDESLVGRRLKREEVIGQPVAKSVFRLLDAVWLGDPRVVEMAKMYESDRTSQ